MNSFYKNIIIVLFLLLVTACKSTNNKSNKASFSKNEAFACYYHDKYNGQKTANGTKFSNKKLTAAHKTLPFGTRVKVTNLLNNKSVIVLINDRGPFANGFEIDLSKKAFMKITDDPKKGKLKVSVQSID